MTSLDPRTAGSPSRRVLVLVERFPTFSETFVVDHVRGLLARDWDVRIACWESDPAALCATEERFGARFRLARFDAGPGRTGPRSRARKLGRAVLELGPRNLSLALTSSAARGAGDRMRAMDRVLSEVRPDVVHAHFGTNGLLASIPARRRRVPLIVNFHGFDVTRIPRAEGWKAYRRLLQGAHGVAHSSFVEQLAREHIGIPVRRVTLGVDLSLFLSPDRPEAWPRPLNLLTVGRLVPQKGQHIALHALALLRRLMPELDTRLTICGEGPQAAALRASTERLGLTGCVRFTGATPNHAVAGLMRGVDVLLVPSQRAADGWVEAFCRVAVEGMASGLPVVVSSWGGLGETVGAGGYVVPDCTARALAEAVVRVVRTTTPAAAAERSRARARAFSLDQTWDDYDAITCEVAHAGRNEPRPQ